MALATPVAQGVQSSCVETVDIVRSESDHADPDARAVRAEHAVHGMCGRELCGYMRHGSIDHERKRKTFETESRPPGRAGAPRPPIS